MKTQTHPENQTVRDQKRLQARYHGFGLEPCGRRGHFCFCFPSGSGWRRDFSMEGAEEKLRIGVSW